jgi:hypothetical protein
MAIPKLALIPSGVKAGKLYSVLPTNGDGDFTTTRNTVATRVNENGLIEEVASNVPRLDYSDGGCPSLLLEPESTNLITYSEDFTQWLKLNGGTGALPVLTSNNIISPDGTQNADKIVFNKGASSSNSDFSLIRLDYGGVDIDGVSSIYLKSDIAVDIEISNDDVSYTTVNVTTEWQRFTVSDATSDRLSMGLRGTTPSNDTATVYAWGAQLEENSYATSYIPNYGTAAGITRSADTANGAGDASTFNDSEGVLMVESSTLVDGESVRVIGLSDGSTNNRISITYHSTLNRIQIFGSKAGDEIFNLEYLNSEKTNLNKVAVKYSASLIEFYYNGFLVDSVVPTDIFNTNTLDRLNFNRITGGNDFYGNTKQLQYFDSALNDSDLEKLTSWTSFTAMANGQSYTII